MVWVTVKLGWREMPASLLCHPELAEGSPPPPEILRQAHDDKEKQGKQALLGTASEDRGSFTEGREGRQGLEMRIRQNDDV